MFSGKDSHDSPLDPRRKGFSRPSTGPTQGRNVTLYYFSRTLFLSAHSLPPLGVCPLRTPKDDLGEVYSDLTSSRLVSRQGTFCHGQALGVRGERGRETRNLLYQEGGKGKET